jgi:hypothetical protein
MILLLVLAEIGENLKSLDLIAYKLNGLVEFPWSNNNTVYWLFWLDPYWSIPNGLGPKHNFRFVLHFSSITSIMVLVVWCFWGRGDFCLCLQKWLERNDFVIILDVIQWFSFIYNIMCCHVLFLCMFLVRLFYKQDLAKI